MAVLLKEKREYSKYLSILLVLVPVQPVYLVVPADTIFKSDMFSIIRISVISNNGATSRQAGIEEENIEVGNSNEVLRGDLGEVPRGDSGEVGRRNPGEELDARSQQEEEGLPSYLQAVAGGGEEGAWLNIGYQP